MFMDDKLSSEVIKDDVGRFQSGYFYKETTDTSSGNVILRMNVYHPDGGFLYVTYEDRTPENTTDGINMFYYQIHCTSTSYKYLQISATQFVNSLEEPTPMTGGVKEASVNSSGVIYGEGLYVITDKDFNSNEYPEDLSSYCTNLPVFEKSDIEAINAYIDSGDYSGAENADSINNQTSEVDGSVELPQNLLVRSGGTYDYMINTTYIDEPFLKDYVADWSQTVDTIDYSYDCDIRITFTNIKYTDGLSVTKEVKQSYTSPWYTIRQSFPYLGDKSMKLSISASVLNNTVVYKFISMFKTGTILDQISVKGTLVSYDIDKIEVRVRNRCADKSSNYVNTTVDYKKKTTTASVVDKDDNKVDDDQYNDTNVDGSNSTDGVLDSISDGTSLSDIMAFIRSGFGLLGDYGIIALMSRTYLYLPGSIWTIITFFISMLVVICIIKAIKEVLL